MKYLFILVLLTGCSSAKVNSKQQEIYLNQCIDIQNALELKDKGFYFDPDGLLVCQFFFPGKASGSIIVYGKDLKAFYEGFRFTHNKDKRLAMDNCYFKIIDIFTKIPNMNNKLLATYSYETIKHCAEKTGYLIK